jgi:hypothetical protein
MALTFTKPADIDFDPESVTTVSTNTFSTATSASFANGAGNFANGAVTIDVTGINYDQDFIATDTAHPDAHAGDLTINAILANDGVDQTVRPISDGTSDGIGDGGALGSLSATGTFRFEVTGIEEGCEVTIEYHLNNNSDSTAAQTTVIGVESVKGLNNCDFQDVLKYQQLNQKLNGRFDADTKEFSSFKDMLKRIKRIK